MAAVAVPPLLITGMHRSGTSATARLMRQAGLDVGSRLLGPTLDNALGYYEDLEFCDLNLALIAAGVGDDPRHRPDWAFADRIEPRRLAPLRPRAEALVAARGKRGHAWGFKDPRTAVLLDFYDAVAPEAGHLFVYRAPWDVLASLMGTQLRALHGRADVAVRAWTEYNARLLAFRARRPERTVLVHVDAVAHRPGDVIRLVQERAHPRGAAPLDAAAAQDAFVERLLRRTDGASVVAELLLADHPEAMAVYDELEAAADLAATDPAPHRAAPMVDVEARGGRDVAAVLAGAPADGVEDTTRVARPRDVTVPAAAADAGLAALPDELVAVLFAGQLRPAALAAAVAALHDAPDLAAVLLSARDAPGAPCGHDPLGGAEGGAGIVVRRTAWLAARGFAATPSPPGYEAWSFAVACAARGGRIARVPGAIHLPGAPGDDPEIRRRVLELHPSLLTRLARDADRRAADAAGHAAAAEARAAAAAQEVAALRATRAWRLVTRWWRVRERLRRRPRPRSAP